MTAPITPARELAAERDGCAFVRPLPRFTKLDATGAHLPPEATGHVAVLDTQQQLIFAVADLGRMTHAKAEKAVAKLKLLGAHDWRLPTVEELFPIADRTRESPVIDVEFFPGTHSAWYWTSTPAAWSPSDCAWIVLFGRGSAGYSHHSNDAFVRAVRSVGEWLGSRTRPKA